MLFYYYYVIDVCFNSISLDNNNEKQSSSTSCKFQKIETNNVNLSFAQDTDTKIQSIRTILYAVLLNFNYILMFKFII